MSLDIMSLKKALESYQKAIGVIRIKEIDETVTEDEWALLRAGVIQNFEFTYELCWKYMKRWIEENVSPNIVSGVPRIELFRVAAQNGLIDAPQTWMIYHKARNQTSHIYDQNISEDVYLITLDFLGSANDFYECLEKRNV